LISRRRAEAERKIAVYCSKVLGGEKNAVIEAAFGINIQAKTNAVRRVEKGMEDGSRMLLHQFAIHK